MGFVILIIIFMILAIPAVIVVELALLFFTLLLVIADISTLTSKSARGEKLKEEDKGVCEMVVDDTMEALSEVGDVVDLAADAVIITASAVGSATEEIIAGAKED